MKDSPANKSFVKETLAADSAFPEDHLAGIKSEGEESGAEEIRYSAGKRKQRRRQAGSSADPTGTPVDRWSAFCGNHSTASAPLLRRLKDLAGHGIEVRLPGGRINRI